MSESIYDEAKESLASITFTMHYRVKPKMLGRCEDKNLNIIDKTLEQAQNQEKLLELYKKLNNIYEKLHTMGLSELALNSNYYEIEIIKLKQQIKELENDK